METTSLHILFILHIKDSKVACEKWEEIFSRNSFFVDRNKSRERNISKLVSSCLLRVKILYQIQLICTSLEHDLIKFVEQIAKLLMCQN